ncbi:uncharacterized protein BJ171DRAFT_412586, partial [Polychytrium aggregatum]|uniref:uncharacterized protein n=1 Tax=Polychytrium aggregatum TaxID=110093 RepID=UPI0022FF1D34
SLTAGAMVNGTAVITGPTATGTVNANGTAAASPSPCVPGTVLGSFIISAPNISSIFLVGSTVTITWKYSPTVTKPPKTINAFYQDVSITTTWSNKIGIGLTTTNNTLQWTIPPLLDGKYEVRLVPDGKETFNIPQDQMPCFSNGEALPAVSGAFSIQNPIYVSPTVDRFPPNTSHAVRSGPAPVLHAGTLCLLAVWLWLCRASRLWI